MTITTREYVTLDRMGVALFVLEMRVRNRPKHVPMICDRYDESEDGFCARCGYRGWLHQ